MISRAGASNPLSGREKDISIRILEILATILRARALTREDHVSNLITLTRSNDTSRSANITQLHFCPIIHYPIGGTFRDCFFEKISKL